MGESGGTAFSCPRNQYKDLPLLLNGLGAPAAPLVASLVAPTPSSILITTPRVGCWGVTRGAALSTGPAVLLFIHKFSVFARHVAAAPALP